LKHRSSLLTGTPGGAIAIVREGDRITINPGEKSLSLDVGEAEIVRRLSFPPRSTNWNTHGRRGKFQNPACPLDGVHSNPGSILNAG